MAPSSVNPEGRAYAVSGMSCARCVASVSEEVRAVSGVTGVEVDLQTGRMIVHGDEFSDEAICNAVDEAGYQVVSP